jgi:type I restriction enzyme S subunit
LELRPGYKRTEVGVIPDDWNLKPFAELLAFRNGVNADKRSYGQGVRFINVLEPITHSHIHGPEITGRVTLPESVTASYAVVHGDVLFNRTSETQEEVGLAATYVGSERVVFGGFVIRGRPIEGVFDPVYSGYALRAPWIRSQIVPMGQGAIRANISQSNLSLIVAPLPPLPEQRAIAAALSDVDSLLEGLTRLIAKKRDLKQAAMQQLLTGQLRLPGYHGEWEVKKIREFTDCTAGGTPSTQVSSYWGGAIRWMSSGELNLKLVDEVNGRITESGLHNSSAMMLPAKCVLIGLAGQGKTRGTAAMNLVELCTNQSIAAVLPNPAFAPEYLYYNLDSRYEELREMSTGTSGRGGLNLSIIKAIDVRFPPRPEQIAIAAVLSDMDAELSALEARRDKTRALKQGMMQELLTGRTRLVFPAVVESRKDSERTDGRRANIHFKRTVLAAEIIDRLYTEPTFGHVKFEKMIFLVEHLCDVDTGSTYHRDAAGPYDNRAMRSIDSQLRKQKWFDARKIEDRYRYVPMTNRGKHKEYFERYFAGISPAFDTVIDMFRSLKTEKCEIVATLFAAWSDLLRQEGPISDDAIVNEVLNNWHESKKRIPEDRWRKALSWMRDHGFVPHTATGG